MKRDVRAYLFDMYNACGLINQFTHNKSFEEYLGDLMLQSAVERQFGILGEALAQWHKIEPEQVVQISHYRRIIDFRNLLIHGYATVTHAVVWGVIETYLPELCKEVYELLNNKEIN